MFAILQTCTALPLISPELIDSTLSKMSWSMLCFAWQIPVHYLNSRANVASSVKLSLIYLFWVRSFFALTTTPLCFYFSSQLSRQSSLFTSNHFSFIYFYKYVIEKQCAYQEMHVSVWVNECLLITHITNTQIKTKMLQVSQASQVSLAPPLHFQFFLTWEN